MPRLFLVLSLILAACGADGPPEPPSKGVWGEFAVGVAVK